MSRSFGCTCIYRVSKGPLPFCYVPGRIGKVGAWDCLCVYKAIGGSRCVDGV